MIFHLHDQGEITKLAYGTANDLARLRTSHCNKGAELC
jgi:hypothetical protein